MSRYSCSFHDSPHHSNYVEDLDARMAETSTIREEVSRVALELLFPANDSSNGRVRRSKLGNLRDDNCVDGGGSNGNIVETRMGMLQTANDTQICQDNISVRSSFFSFGFSPRRGQISSPESFHCQGHTRHAQGRRSWSRCRLRK